MKVVFLDVDGVLNSEDDLMVFREKNNIHHCILYDEVEERPLQLLKQLIERTDAKIVLSSSWRTAWVTDSGWYYLKEKLETALQSVSLVIYDRTPKLYNKERGDEIRLWLAHHPEVDTFVILDDDSDMCEFIETNLVQTTYKHGLLQEHIDKAIEILNSNINTK
jgi:hypothetical protein